MSAYIDITSDYDSLDSWTAQTLAMALRREFEPDGITVRLLEGQHGGGGPQDCDDDAEYERLRARIERVIVEGSPSDASPDIGLI